ncbi:MAG TPA: phosphonate ABC transporter, permease protein PhnE [Actinopolymorphaceae bacterium]
MATLRDYRVHRRAIARSRLVIWTVILLAFGWATWGTGFGVLTFVQGIGGSFAFIATDLLPPRLEAAPQFIDDAIDTLLMSYVGMVMSVVLSLPLGVLGARNTTVHRLLSYASKGTVSFIRAAPDLIFAIFLVALFGIGPLAGTVAMGISGIGILGKAYADGIEAIDMQQVEGIRAAGGTWFQVLGQGVWPQFKPTFITWSLYRLDLNIREAAVLGLVGAGGLGYALITEIRTFQYRTATTVILMIFVMILLVEFVTGILRRRVL